MKLFIATLLLSLSAFAGGKLTLQNNLHNDGKDYRPMFGLSIYQPLFWKMSFTSWTGMGEQPFDMKEDVQWFTSKNQVDFRINKWTVSPGYQYSEIITYKENRSFAYVKVDYQLW